MTPPERLTEPALWFAFRKAEILVVSGAEQPALPCCMDIGEHGLAPQRNQYLGLYSGKHCFAVEIHESQPLPAGWAAMGLRDLFGMVETTLAALSGRAYQILEWDRNHQYCSRCGTPTQLRTDERSRTCPACKYTTYPPISPAIMILITNGKKLLLARKASFPNGRFSALAGFVGPGEMLIEPGSLGSSSKSNQRASSISTPSGVISPPAYSAVKATISECGNGHGWLPK